MREKETTLLIAGLLIGALLGVYLCYLYPITPCSDSECPDCPDPHLNITFPNETDSYGIEEGDYYIVLNDQQVYLEGVSFNKEIFLINGTDIDGYNFTGEISEWDGEWIVDTETYFPFTGTLTGTPYIPATYGNYSLMAELILTSVYNVIDAMNATFLNASVNYQNNLCPMTLETSSLMPYYTQGDYIVNQTYLAVEYNFEAWIFNDDTNATIQLIIELIAECNTGIPLQSSYYLATWDEDMNLYAIMIYGFKTILTSIPLPAVANLL